MLQTMALSVSRCNRGEEGQWRLLATGLAHDAVVAHCRSRSLSLSTSVIFEWAFEALQDRSSAVPMLKIRNDANTEQNVHIVCHSWMEIAKEPSITGRCRIVGVTRPCDDVSDPGKGARIRDEEPSVTVRDALFLGVGVVVLPNLRVARRCVVGSLSVVTANVPDYSVAARSPARVIRQYDGATKTSASARVPKG